MKYLGRCSAKYVKSKVFSYFYTTPAIRLVAHALHFMTSKCLVIFFQHNYTMNLSSSQHFEFNSSLVTFWGRVSKLKFPNLMKQRCIDLLANNIFWGLVASSSIFIVFCYRIFLGLWFVFYLHDRLSICVDFTYLLNIFWRSWINHINFINCSRRQYWKPAVKI